MTPHTILTYGNLFIKIRNSIIHSSDSIIEKLKPSALTGMRHSIYPDGPVNTKYDQIHQYKVTLPKYLPEETKQMIKRLPDRIKEVAMSSAIDLLDKKEITLVSYRPLAEY